MHILLKFKHICYMFICVAFIFRCNISLLAGSFVSQLNGCRENSPYFRKKRPSCPLKIHFHHAAVHRQTYVYQFSFPSTQFQLERMTSGPPDFQPYTSDAATAQTNPPPSPPCGSACSSSHEENNLRSSALAAARSTRVSRKHASPGLLIMQG